MMLTSSNSTMASLMGSMASVQDFADDDLVEMVEKFRRANKLMEMENFVMERHLRKNDPKCLANMEHVLEQANRIHKRMLQRGERQSQISIASRSSTASVSSMRSRMSQMSGVTSLPQGKRINMFTKMELLKKERDTFAESVDEFYRKAAQKHNSLIAQIQQMRLQKSETLEAMAIFEEHIAKDSVDPLTQKIPVDKFVRHLEDWLRCAEAIIAKLRLRCSSLHYKCIFLRQQLKQKGELGETLLPVDLEQMKIEYQVLMEKLEQKNNDLMDLKKKSGDAGFALTQHKKQLLQQMQELDAIQRKIVKEKKKITVLTQSVDTVKNEVTVSEQKLQNIVYLVENFTAPELLDYIMKKKELMELQKIIKVWTRRTGIQTNALKAHIQQMKRLTGAKKTDEKWFILPVKEDTKNSSDNEEDLELVDQD